LNDMQGYYLLAYKPDASTFGTGRRRQQFHRIEVLLNLA
jgi:hypothetical protein